jgi:hypothetical protein
MHWHLRRLLLWKIHFLLLEVGPLWFTGNTKPRGEETG